MECQVEKDKHFQHRLLFTFHQGSKFAKTAHNICAMYGEGTIAGKNACD